MNFILKRLKALATFGICAVASLVGGALVLIGTILCIPTVIVFLAPVVVIAEAGSILWLVLWLLSTILGVIFGGTTHGAQWLYFNGEDLVDWFMRYMLLVFGPGFIGMSLNEHIWDFNNELWSSIS
jgi:energy-coupling factor transporter transmembrane protein EcfT